MIPHGAKPIGAPRVAELHGITPNQLRGSGLHRTEGFPPQLNPGGRIGIWDERQVIAHRDGTEMPEVITDDALLGSEERNPLDLLTDIEAAAAMGVSEATWRRKAVNGRTDATAVDVCGQRYWLRGTITRRHEVPPGTFGRKVGDRDLRPRKPRSS